ncbi:MAG: glutaredoxin family protein [Synechococcus sp.]|nr:glutaredoxin family protein [Synechococcus sp.]
MDCLVLITRRGCCLCEGLEQKLAGLVPPPAVALVDVDGDPVLQHRYGLEVPVLLIRRSDGDRELPRLPPRLAGASLRAWLQKHGWFGQDG